MITANKETEKVYMALIDLHAKKRAWLLKNIDRRQVSLSTESDRELALHKAGFPSLHDVWSVVRLKSFPEIYGQKIIKQDTAIETASLSTGDAMKQFAMRRLTLTLEARRDAMLQEQRERELEDLEIEAELDDFDYDECF